MASSVEVDRGADTDVESCLALWRDAVLGRDGLAADQASLEAQLVRARQQLERPDRILLLARDKQGPTGFVVGFPEPASSGTHLVLIATAPRAQGLGVAGKLLNEFAEQRRQQGDSWLDLRVLADNHGARRLYQRLGWQPVGELEPHEVTGKLFQWYQLVLV